MATPYQETLGPDELQTTLISSKYILSSRLLYEFLLELLGPGQFEVDVSGVLKGKWPFLILF